MSLSTSSFSSHFGGEELLWKVEGAEIGFLCFQRQNGKEFQTAKGKKSILNIFGLGFDIFIASSGVAHSGWTKSYSGRFAEENIDLVIEIFPMLFDSSLKASKLTIQCVLYQINKGKDRVHVEMKMSSLTNYDFKIILLWSQHSRKDYYRSLYIHTHIKLNRILKPDIIVLIIQKFWGFISQSIPTSKQAIFLLVRETAGTWVFPRHRCFNDCYFRRQIQNPILKNVLILRDQRSSFLCPNRLPEQWQADVLWLSPMKSLLNYQNNSILK